MSPEGDEPTEQRKNLLLRMLVSEMLEQVHREVWPLYAAGRMKVLVSRTFPLAEAAAAHAWMESGAASGKTILVV